jgi:hypothetical protein
MAQAAKIGGRPIRASMRCRSLVLLAGIAALIAQLFLAPLHVAAAAPSSASLAELSALTGQRNVLCADLEHQPGAPAHGDADCPDLCCQLGHGVAAFLPPSPIPLAVVVGRFTDLKPPLTIAPCAAAHWPSAQPRGPPIAV